MVDYRHIKATYFAEMSTMYVPALDRGELSDAMGSQTLFSSPKHSAVCRSLVPSELETFMILRKGLAHSNSSTIHYYGSHATLLLFMFEPT